MANAAADPKNLHVRVIRASAAFGSDPVDVLSRVFDVARFAMNAVLGIDLQPGPSVRVIDELINACRTIALLRPIVER
jgi:hypothetical protein